MDFRMVAWEMVAQKGEPPLCGGGREGLRRGMMWKSGWFMGTNQGARPQRPGRSVLCEGQALPAPLRTALLLSGMWAGSRRFWLADGPRHPGAWGGQPVD
mgnify:CR=1 FL=1